jgi:hypothetical protein
MTTNMQNTPCPTVIDCSIQATLINNGVSLSTTVPIEQNCGNGAAPTKQVSAQSTAPVNYTLYIFILVIFIAFMSAILLMTMIDSDPTATAV